MGRVRSLLLALLLIGAAAVVVVQLVGDDDAAAPASTVATTSTTLPAVGPDIGTVTYVFDGDTVEVDIAGDTERVRLIGIDTPEAEVEGRPPECFSAEATALARALLPIGTRVQVVRGVRQRDDFGRLLAYLYRVPEGTLVNEELLRQGAGELLIIRPNTTLASRFRAAVAAAETAGAGFWSACPAS